MDLQFECEYVSYIERNDINNMLTLDINNVNIEHVSQEIIDNLNASHLIKMFNDNNSLLDVIGVDECKNYFDLKETEKD